ncbi:MAG TPA: hypothetical protein DCS52_19815, partial [Bradyrhizobium sp.]|nr:hypothetical protein [Bradyrhizobium sp.]
GVATNIPLLGAILVHQSFARNKISTNFIDTHVAALVGAAKEHAAPLLEVSEAAATKAVVIEAAPEGSLPVPAPLQGTIVAIEVAEGDLVRPGQQIAVLESMKM